MATNGSTSPKDQKPLNVSQHGLLLAVCLFMFSQAATLVRFAAAPAITVCFWRLGMAGVILLPFAMKRERRETLKLLNAREHAQVFLSGLFMFAHFYFFFVAVQMTTIADATILFSLNPVSTAIGAYLIFNEKLTLRLQLAGALAFVGILAMTLQNASRSASWQGDLCGLAAAICFSGYILTGKSVRRKLANSVYTSLIYFLSAALSGLAMLALKLPFSGYSRQTWLSFLALALLPTLLGHALFSYLINYFDINVLSCLTLTEPVFATVSAAFLFAEPITTSMAAGFLLTTSAILVLYWSQLRRSSR